MIIFTMGLQIAQSMVHYLESRKVALMDSQIAHQMIHWLKSKKVVHAARIAATFNSVISLWKIGSSYKYYPDLAYINQIKLSCEDECDSYFDRLDHILHLLFPPPSLVNDSVWKALFLFPRKNTKRSITQQTLVCVYICIYKRSQCTKSILILAGRNTSLPRWSTGHPLLSLFCSLFASFLFVDLFRSWNRNDT